MSIRKIRLMDSAPKDGTPIDLYRKGTGWINDVWWDATAIDDPDIGQGWVTLCPGPFIGWRPIPKSRYRDL